MKTKVIFICVALLILAGCSSNRKYVELQLDTFAEMDVSQVIAVYAMDGPHPYPDQSVIKGVYWMPGYTDGLPIKEPEKIKIIYECIKNAKKVKRWNADFNNQKLIFETKNRAYHLGADWNYEIAVGDWWESTELPRYFEQWGVREFGKRNPKQSEMDYIWSPDPNGF